MASVQTHWAKMTNASIIIGMKPSGAYKAYFWGRADAHISDWRGTNYRIAPVDGQPSRGFKTYKDAENFARAKFQSEDQITEAARYISGSHFSDSRANRMEWKTIDISR